MDKREHLLILELSLILPRGRFICASDKDFFTGCTPGDEDGDTLCLLRFGTHDDVDDAVVGGGYATGQVGSDGVLPIGFLAPVELLALAARSAGETRIAGCAAAGGCVACGHWRCLRVCGRHGALAGGGSR